MQYAWEQAGGYLVDGALTTDVAVGDFAKEYTGVAGDLFIKLLFENEANGIDGVQASDLFDLAAIDMQSELSGLTIDYGNEVYYDGRGRYQGNMNPQKWERKPNVPAQSALPYSLSYETFRNPGPNFTVDLEADAETKIQDADSDDSHYSAGYASQTDSVLPSSTRATSPST